MASIKAEHKPFQFGTAPGWYVILFDKPMEKHLTPFLPSLAVTCGRCCPVGVSQAEKAAEISTELLFRAQVRDIAAITIRWDNGNHDPNLPHDHAILYGPYNLDVDPHCPPMAALHGYITGALRLDHKEHTWIHYQPYAGEKTVGGLFETSFRHYEDYNKRWRQNNNEKK